MDNSFTNELWKRYKKSPADADRETLVRQYMPLVKYMTDRIVYRLPAEVRANDREDLYIEGVIGLMDAIERFDPGKNVKFETYAGKRVRGAIIDSLRKDDILPKNVREAGRKIEKAYALLEAQKGRPATDEEVMKELGMTNNEFYGILDKMKGISLVSMDSELFDSDGDKFYFQDLIGMTDTTLEQFEKQDAVKQLASVIEGFPSEERALLEMYYWDGLTYKEIGIAMGLSESRVCQLHTKLILKLRSGFRKLERER